MLVLTRKMGERIILQLPGGAEIAVAVVEVCRHAGKVRVGIDAPREVIILREELVRGYNPPGLPPPFDPA